MSRQEFLTSVLRLQIKVKRIALGVGILCIEVSQGSQVENSSLLSASGRCWFIDHFQWACLRYVLFKLIIKCKVYCLIYASTETGLKEPLIGVILIQRLL